MGTLQLLCFAIAYGLIKQKHWVKFLVAVWYGLLLLVAGYTIYTVFGQGGFAPMYLQNFFDFNLLIVIAPLIITFLVNTFAAYYVLAKANLNN